MRIEAVLKVGGSLSRADRLPALCQAMGRLGAAHRLVVVPGGGEFAGQVRAAYRKFHLGETPAHRMALLAMDQYGWLLYALTPGSILTASLDPAHLSQAGRIPILLPAARIQEVDPLPHSWQVTSDTIAAWVAQELTCPRLVLLKDVDGLFEGQPEPGGPGRLIAELSVEELAGRSGGVDEYLATFLASASLETWVINGRRPDRLGELLDSGATLGTRIRPATGADSPEHR